MAMQKIISGQIYVVLSRKAAPLYRRHLAGLLFVVSVISPSAFVRFHEVV